MEREILMVDLICPYPSQCNNRDVIVNDRGSGRVQKFDLDGNFILNLAVLERIRSSLESLNIWLWISSTIFMLTMQDQKTGVNSQA